MVQSQRGSNPVFKNEKEDVTEIKVLPKQRKIANSRDRVVTAIGGVQSGKTYASLMGIARVLGENPGEMCFLLAPSFGQIEAAALPKLKSILQGLDLYNPNDPDSWNKSSHEITCTNGAKLRYFSASNPERFQSVTTPGVMIDEISEVPERLIDIALERVAVMEGTVFLAGLIPHPDQLINHWIYDRIYKPYQEGSDDITMEVFSSDENPFFPQERYEQAKQEMPEPIFRAEYKGEFVESLLSDNVFVPSSVDMAQRRWRRRVHYLPDTLYHWVRDRAKIDETPKHRSENFSKAQGAYVRGKPDKDSDKDTYSKYRQYKAEYGRQKASDEDARDDYEQDDPEAGIIKYDIKEQANKLLRGPKWDKNHIILSVDVADEGQDESIITARWGNTTLGQQNYVISTDRLVDKIEDEAEWFKQRGYKVTIWVDAPGLGKAVINDVRSDGYRVNEYWPSDTTPDEPRRYLNLKSWLFFQGRKRMLRGVEAIPQERTIRRQVLSQSYESTDKDKIKMVKDKDNSLDYCDSYVISLMGVDAGVDPTENVFFI